jgi:hypothetical protein
MTHPLVLLHEIRAVAPREIHRLLDRLEIAVVNSRPSRVDPLRVRALHRQRLTDAQIGERLGVTGSAVLYWRRKLMLAAWR